MSQVPVKRDWKKIIAESNGALISSPEKFIEKIKEWDKRRKELSALANAAAKHELETRLLLENTVAEIRAHLESAGYPEIWLADVGFSVDALQDGEFVLTVSEMRK